MAERETSGALRSNCSTLKAASAAPGGPSLANMQPKERTVTHANQRLIQTVIADGSHSARMCQTSPLQRDEELLLEYAATGSQDAFGELVRLYERDIYDYFAIAWATCNWRRTLFRTRSCNCTANAISSSRAVASGPGSTRSPPIKRSTCYGETGGIKRSVSVPRRGTPAAITGDGRVAASGKPKLPTPASN